MEISMEKARIFTFTEKVLVQTRLAVSGKKEQVSSFNYLEVIKVIQQRSWYPKQINKYDALQEKVTYVGKHNFAVEQKIIFFF